MSRCSEPVESASPAGAAGGPQDWKFEWTVEEAPAASQQPNSAPATPEAPEPAPLQSQPNTSPANQTGACVQSPGSVVRRRRLRAQRRRQAADRAGCAGLTACLRRVASGTAGLRRELHALSDNVLGLHGELRALVGAVSAIASALQGHHGQLDAERHSATPPEAVTSPTSDAVE